MRQIASSLGLSLLAACSQPDSKPDWVERDLTPGGAAVPATASATTTTSPATVPATATAAATVPTTATATATGRDFLPEALALFRVAACGGTAPIPADLDAKAVDRHCRSVQERIAKFRARYFGEMQAFFAGLRPADLPRTVVYPFGGGDLLSALVAFPDATEITTISLELAGDPRRITGLDRRRLELSLRRLRTEIGGLLSTGSNTSVNLSSAQGNELPAQVSSFLMGLAAGGFEPTAMRFFRLADDGSVVYLDDAAIAAIEATETARRKASARKSTWLSPSFSEAFAHVELRYRKPGETTERVHRHLAWNLSDDYLAAHPELLRHLEAKGRPTMLTKGASYLLWRDDFSTIRDYLLSRLTWMLSDSTGVPPEFARAAGMEQETYGTFRGPFLSGAEGRHARAFRALWEAQPRRNMPYRFGYFDSHRHPHNVVTRPATPPAK